jgi:dihydroxyacetone kinase DhaKLM complex PTS-EIIA-like component DhaM
MAVAGLRLQPMAGAGAALCRRLRTEEEVAQAEVEAADTYLRAAPLVEAAVIAAEAVEQGATAAVAAAADTDIAKLES